MIVLVIEGYSSGVRETPVPAPLGRGRGVGASPPAQEVRSVQGATLPGICFPENDRRSAR